MAVPPIPPPATVFVGDGWGGEVNGQSTSNAFVKVTVWASVSLPVDFADITVNVANVNEPPLTSDL